MSESTEALHIAKASAKDEFACKHCGLRIYQITPTKAIHSYSFTETGNLWDLKDLAVRLDFLPALQIGTESDGQVVVYTGLRITDPNAESLGPLDT